MQKEEIWKDIQGFEGYQVSNLGRIRTHNKITFTQKHGYRKWKDRILKQKWCSSTSKKNRYDARVCLWKNGKEYTLLVARLVATAFFGQSDLTVNHIDGNSKNNNIENLEWVSRKENIVKGFDMGLYPTKKVIIIDKITNKKNIYRSLSLGSKAIKKNNGYLSCQIKRNKFENDNYKWELI